MSDSHRDREDPLDISLIEMLGHTAGPLPVEPQVTTMPDISARKTRASSSCGAESSSLTYSWIWP